MSSFLVTKILYYKIICIENPRIPAHRPPPAVKPAGWIQQTEQKSGRRSAWSPAFFMDYNADVRALSG